MGSAFRLGRPTTQARALRNHATEHERLLWTKLKSAQLYGLKFSRQMPIAGYVCDFVCRSQRIVVEVDGGQHADAASYDEQRTAAIKKAGYRVIRFWNNELTSNIDGVLEAIAAAARGQDVAPTPQPLPQAGGEPSDALSPGSEGLE